MAIIFPQNTKSGGYRAWETPRASPRGVHSPSPTGLSTGWTSQSSTERLPTTFSARPRAGGRDFTISLVTLALEPNTGLVSCSVMVAGELSYPKEPHPSESEILTHVPPGQGGDFLKCFSVCIYFPLSTARV